MTEDDLFGDELPADAKEVLDGLESRLAKQQAAAREEQGAIRARLEAQLAEVSARLEEEGRKARQKAMKALKPLQEKYLLAGKLDEALAIRAELRKLRLGEAQVLPTPANLTQFGPQDAGKTVAFQVVGSTEGPVWGTDVYTLDSRLSTAAVHAGAVAAGATAVVRVTLVSTADQPSFAGTQRNGVVTNNWGPYPMGYRFVR